MNETRTIEEAYTSACSASSLKVEADVRGSADLMIVAGWNNARVGSALMRLVSEWEGSETPRPGKWFENEAMLLAIKLKSLASVKAQVSIQAHKWGAQRPDAVASGVILNWLDGVCHSCDGLKFLKVADAPSLSAKMCRACDGSGRARIPHGELGKRLMNWMDRCVSDSKIGMSKSLKQSMGRV